MVRLFSSPMEVMAKPLSKLVSCVILDLDGTLLNRWCNIKAQADAKRLINHLRSHGVPMALASNSPRTNIETKISYHQGWKESFSVIIGGDEVTSGKPSPEIYIEAAKRLRMNPSSCLVIEDSPPGFTADLRQEKWGLPAFEDWIGDTLPIEPWCIGGPVIKGLGRGSKEPWLVHDFNEDFYGEELRLAIVGYVRPEANFPSLDRLVAKIHKDRKIMENALELPLYSKYKEDPYLKS